MKSPTFITGNPNKAAQLGKYLSFEVQHAKLDIPEIQSLILEEVATEKAKAAYAELSTPVLVEDTALTFVALNGLPGTFVKWFLESVGNQGMVDMLKGHEERRAVAETCFALCDETGVQLFLGECRGSVPTTPRGEGFGWNPIFVPEGETLTWAEMRPEQTVKTSMRRRAIKKLQLYLEENYT